MKTRALSMGLIVPALLAAAEPSFAQAYGQPYQSFIDTLVTNRVWEKSLKSSPGSESQPTSGAAGSRSTPATGQDIVRNLRAPATTPGQTTRAVQFTSTGTRITLDEYADALGGTAQDKAETKALLTGFLNRFDADAAVLGVPNDLPLAIVTYITVNTAVYSDRPLLSNDRIIELRNALAIELTRGGSLERMTDRQKQGAYEFSLMTAGMIQYFFEKAKKEKNADDLKSCKVVAAENLKRFGVDPER
jgi:hypothetical protein